MKQHERTIESVIRTIWCEAIRVEALLANERVTARQKDNLNEAAGHLDKALNELKMCLQ